MLVPYFNHRDSALFNPFRELDDFACFTADALTTIRTDIEEDEDSFILSADLPGFEKNDIYIDIENSQLMIKAERHSNHEKKDKRDTYLRCERSYGSYTRSFNLEGIDSKNVSASYENGVLKLTLPKQTVQKESTRRLEIQ